MNEVYSHTIYGLDFKDADGNLLKEMNFGRDEEAMQDYYHRLDDDDSLWPDGAARVDHWQRNVMRPPIRGIDYGPGSQKRRFGNGRVPRGVHQFRNRE